MDEELILEINKIVSLAYPESVLPSPSHQSSSKAKISEPKTSAKKKMVVKYSAGPSSKQVKSKQSIFPGLSKKCRKYLGMKTSEWQFRIEDDKVIGFCQDHELIAREVICSCGNIMELEPKTWNGCNEWICYDKSHKVTPHQSILKGTWFEDAEIPIADVLWIAYMWVHEYSSMSMMHECSHSGEILNDWCEYCLLMCKEIIERKRNPIGGEGRSVEIFECKITKNKKKTEKWAFCGIEQYSTNLFELVLDNKNSNTVFQIFDKYFLPGTKVITHNWTPYKNLNQGDFLLLTKKKFITFFDVSTKKNLDEFSDFKRAATRPAPGRNRWSKLEYGPSFFEKMYRKSLTFATDAYLTFLHDIAMVYKPVDKFSKSSTEASDEDFE